MTILITTHPVSGMRAERYSSMEEAKAAAFSFRDQHYSDVRTHDVHTLVAWFLLEDDGMPFFFPKPWPFALGYEERDLAQLLQGNPNPSEEEDTGEPLPAWMILLAVGQSFGGRPAQTEEEAKKFFEEMVADHGGELLENEGGGYTFVWESLPAGFAFKLS